MKDPKVQQNPAYLSVILLSRVVTQLGDLPMVTPRIIESLFTMDLAYLQDLYQRINMADMPVYRVTCPHCGKEHDVPLDFLLA